MDDPGTDAIRKLAPSWTLAGDEQLLSILQNTHQRLVSKCQEANSQLEQMATALNDASISLQNVNNQFMALSSSQFIESRVYDDDELATDVPAVKEPPKPEIPDELTSLKRSISVLENAHEIITILQDSDTESDTDDEMPARMVLKPKDMYASRPLPYIIGSQPWKNKWHAGLLLEDSDSDSSASKVEHDSEQYSQSEPEDTHTHKLPLPIHTQSTVSETSSELPSEQGSVPKPTPSDVASEIARRLGAREPVKMVEREPEEEEPPKPTVRKIYRPQDPISTTIFPDEPPPLSDQSDSDSDIFAALHRAQPHASTQRYESTHAADQLFPDQSNSDHADIFSDFANKPASNSTANSTSIFDAGPEPNMFVKHADSRHTADRHRKHIQDADHRRQAYDRDDSRKEYEGRGDGDDFRGRGEEEAERGVKKPVGGISLFGNKGTESIGAAILKRNQRKSSTSGDESGSDSRSESQSNQQMRTEKDIFDDLFARSESQKVTKEKDFSKDLKTEIKKKVEVKEKKIEKPKVDLFSDNLFDDIDDIFSTNVVKMPTKDTAKQKSIFEDDDDLFAEIAAPKPMKVEVASSSNKNNKSLFDSDDELFSENTPVNKPKETSKTVEINKPKVAEITKVNESSNIKKETTKSIFDDDEYDLFSDLKTNEVSKVQNKPVIVENSRDFAKEDKTTNIAPSIIKSFRSPSLFDYDDDDDDDGSDLFAEPAKSSNINNVITAPIKERKLPSQNDDKTSAKPASQTHEETSTKLSSQINEEISKKPSSETDEKILTKPSSQTEVKIPEEIVYATPSSPVKTDENEETIAENKHIGVNKDSNKPDKIVNTPKTERIFENEDSVLPVSKNVDSKKENVETNAARIFDHIKNMEQSSSDTNNDFSDQDFDDLPPKEETYKTVVNDSNKITEKHNIFDKVTLEEDIDELFVTSQQNTAKTETIFNIIPDFTEPITEKTETDNKKGEMSPKTIEADIFTNIITEPPVFEKPKEPKKSKNVNALFDDDSDDESLFFKKNDPIFVEHPAEFTPTQDRIFGLFTDEPPDDGFSKISDEFDDDMFSTVPKPKIPQHEYPPIPNFEYSTTINNKIPEIEKSDPVEEINSDLPKDEEKPAVEITKEHSLDTEKDIFKLPTEGNIDKGQNSSSVLSEDEQLFKTSTKESKPVLKEKPSLDFLSDDDNLFASKPKVDKPTKLTPKPEFVPQSKNITTKVKPTADSFSDDENLFAPKIISEKPSLESTKEGKPETKSLASNEIPNLDKISLIQEKPVLTNAKATLEEKPSLDDFSVEENIFASKPTIEKSPIEQEKPVPENTKPTLKEKPSLDFLSDDVNIFTSKPALEKPSFVPEKPVPENTKPILKEKPSIDFLSDDENLFTSKPTLEKPPLVQTVPKNENITTKVKPTSNLSSDDENFFTSVPTLEKPIKQEKPVIKNKNQETVSKSSDDELFSSLEKTEIPKLSENKLIQQDPKSDEDLFKIPAKPEFVPKPSESKPEKSEKKVGKLKVGLNINVNALLPGASPKKVKPNDQPDGQSQSVVENQRSEPKIHSEVRKPESKINSEVRKPEPENPSQNTDSKLLKSVSFDGKPESDVLDNKLSKERAKIQVKRRPSTRRARREAVRKSGIDFGDDSTDNSSSIDDPPRKHPEVSKKVAKATDISQNIHPNTPEVQAKVDDTTVQAKTDPVIQEKEPKVETEAIVAEKPPKVETEAIVVEKPPKIEPEVTDKPTYSKDVKSKVIYILNDEDIFNTSPVESISENITKNLNSNIGVSTLGKAYPEKSSKNDAKSSLFGDDNDEEMFKPKTVVNKSTIFDSDSEEDLFGTPSKREETKVEKVEVKKEIKREVVKRSLFGDEDEDDDLFGVKTKKIVDQKPPPSRTTVKETPKPTEPVFEDPLSMFGDDD